MRTPVWIDQQWETARSLTSAGPYPATLLILDEIQKFPNWSETVKRLWDEDTAAHRNLSVVLLGSSPLLVQKGLGDSLAGRFEILPVTHWSFTEMRDAFGWNLDQFVYFGGYPGTAGLVDDLPRWRNYVVDSLVETSVSRDVLQMTRVDKPALLRRLFELAAAYSGQVFSYQKMLGQLTDAGNTTTLAHYLRLLEGAGLVAGISKFSGEVHRQRASSPKLMVLNTALMTALSGHPPSALHSDSVFRGHLVETAVGAHLANTIRGTDCTLHYWRQGDLEVDFVLCRGPIRLAIEVKSGPKTGAPALERFVRLHPGTRPLLVGQGGIPLERFLSRPAPAWLE